MHEISHSPEFLEKEREGLPCQNVPDITPKVLVVTTSTSRAVSISQSRTF